MLLQRWKCMDNQRSCLLIVYLRWSYESSLKRETLALLLTVGEWNSSTLSFSVMLMCVVLVKEGV